MKRPRRVPGQRQETPLTLEEKFDRLFKRVTALEATVAANERKYANAGGLAGVRPSAFNLPLALCRPPPLTAPESAAVAAFTRRAALAPPAAAADRAAGADRAAATSRAAVRAQTAAAALEAAELADASRRAAQARAAAQGAENAVEAEAAFAAAAAKEETAEETAKRAAAALVRVEKEAKAAEVEAVAGRACAKRVAGEHAGGGARARAARRREAVRKEAEGRVVSERREELLVEAERRERLRVDTEGEKEVCADAERGEAEGVELEAVGREESGRDDVVHSDAERREVEGAELEAGRRELRVDAEAEEQLHADWTRRKAERAKKKVERAERKAKRREELRADAERREELRAEQVAKRREESRANAEREGKLRAEAERREELRAEAERREELRANAKKKGERAERNAKRREELRADAEQREELRAEQDAKRREESRAHAEREGNLRAEAERREELRAEELRADALRREAAELATAGLEAGGEAVVGECAMPEGESVELATPSKHATVAVAAGASPAAGVPAPRVTGGYRALAPSPAVSMTLSPPSSPRTDGALRPECSTECEVEAVGEEHVCEGCEEVDDMSEACFAETPLRKKAVARTGEDSDRLGRAANVAEANLLRKRPRAELEKAERLLNDIGRALCKPDEELSVEKTEVDARSTEEITMNVPGARDGAEGEVLEDDAVDVGSAVGVEGRAALNKGTGLDVVRIRHRDDGTQTQTKRPRKAFMVVDKERADAATKAICEGAVNVLPRRRLHGPQEPRIARGYRHLPPADKVYVHGAHGGARGNSFRSVCHLPRDESGNLLETIYPLHGGPPRRLGSLVSAYQSPRQLGAPGTQGGKGNPIASQSEPRRASSAGTAGQGTLGLDRTPRTESLDDVGKPSATEGTALVIRDPAKSNVGTHAKEGNHTANPSTAAGPSAPAHTSEDIEIVDLVDDDDDVHQQPPTARTCSPHDPLLVTDDPVSNKADSFAIATEAGYFAIPVEHKNLLNTSELLSAYKNSVRSPASSLAVFLRCGKNDCQVALLAAADLYRNGCGEPVSVEERIRRNPKAAIALLDEVIAKSEEKSLVFLAAMNTRGVMARDGEGSEVDFGLALSHFERSHSLGSIDGSVLLSRLLVKGLVTKKFRNNQRALGQMAKRARLLLNEALEKDSAIAAFSIGVIYSNCGADPSYAPVAAAFDSGCVGVHHERATFRMFERAACLGSAEAFNMLGIWHCGGKARLFPSFRMALQSFARAWELGSVKASYNAGSLVETGMNGKFPAKVSASDALTWYARGAAAGHALSAFHLGQMYDDGNGTQEDKEKAERLYLWALDANNDGDRNRAFAADVEHCLISLYMYQVIVKNDGENGSWIKKLDRLLGSERKSRQRRNRLARLLACITTGFDFDGDPVATGGKGYRSTELRSHFTRLLASQYLPRTLAKLVAMVQTPVNVLVACLRAGCTLAKDSTDALLQSYAALNGMLGSAGAKMLYEACESAYLPQSTAGAAPMKSRGNADAEIQRRQIQGQQS